MVWVGGRSPTGAPSARTRLSDTSRVHPCPVRQTIGCRTPRTYGRERKHRGRKVVYTHSGVLLSFAPIQSFAPIKRVFLHGRNDGGGGSLVGEVGRRG